MTNPRSIASSRRTANGNSGDARHITSADTSNMTSGNTFGASPDVRAAETAGVSDATASVSTASVSSASACLCISS
jgi:hypothetical protein